MSKISQTNKIIQSIRDKTDTAVLFYSAGGKDGIVLLDILAKKFKKVICYYMYLVDGLEHIKPYIVYAEKMYNNVEVRRIPHWMVSVIEKNGFFCDPRPEIKKQGIGDIEEFVRKETGVEYAFSGMKGVDGFQKRMRLKMWHPMYTSPKGMVYPLALWTNKEVLDYIKLKNLIQPYVYNPTKASQGLGLDYQSLKILKEKHPNDLKKVLQKFPYAEIALINGNKKTKGE